MEFLKEILSDGYTAFEAAIKTFNEKPENAEKQIKIADIGSGSYVSKSKYDALDTAKKNLETQLQTATDSIKTFEGIEPDKLQGELAALRTNLDTQKTAYEQQIADMQFGSTIETALRTAGARNAKAVMALLDMDDLKASKDQTADIEAAIKACQKDNSYLFGSSEPINNPVAPTGGNTGGVDANTAALRAAMGLSEQTK